MKRVEIERQAIVKALDATPNITAAAKQLGAARRTLQARMRDYGMKPGEPGRPRELLPHKSGGIDLSNAFPVLAVVAVVGLAVVVWRARKKDDTAQVGGLDLLGTV